MSAPFNWADYETAEETNDAEKTPEFNWDDFQEVRGTEAEKQTPEARNVVNARVVESLKRKGKQYLGGLATGFGGELGNLTEMLQFLGPSEHEPKSYSQAALLEGLQEEGTVPRPETKGERYAQNIGTRAGQGAFYGAPGGPAGIGIGGGVGAVSGALEQSLEELGVPDWLKTAIMLGVIPLGGAGPAISAGINKYSAGRSAALQQKFHKKPIEQVPRSRFETDKAALSIIQGKEAQTLAQEEAAAKPSYLPKETPAIVGPKIGEAKSLAGRVTKSTEDLGMKPVGPAAARDQENEVGKVFTETPFYNTTKGGEAIKSNVAKTDDAAYRQVNKNYKVSKEKNKLVEDIHPTLVNKMQERLDELLKIPEPSGPQKQLIIALKKNIKAMAEIEEDQIVGYKPISNQTLIDQKQSLGQKIDHDFAHGDARNIFKPTMADIDEAVLAAAEASGVEGAAESYNVARASYKKWAEDFDNPYIRPIRDVSNKDYSKTLKGALDVDEFNQLNKVLQMSPEGQQLSQATKRELANKYLDKYKTRSLQASMKDFEKDLRELSAVLSPEEVDKVRNAFIESKRTAGKGFKATNISKAERAAGHYAKMDPENIQEMMNKRSGIKRIKDFLNDTPKEQKVFKDLVDQKTRSLLQGGKIKTKFSGNELRDRINAENNYDLLVEMHGQEFVDSALEEAERIGKASVTRENINKLVKKSAAVKFFGSLLGVV